METKNYHKTITVTASPEEAMKKISEVHHWWKHDCIGSASQLNDTFTIPFGEADGVTSFVDFVVSELVPNQKVVWKVTDCYLPWFQNKKEWNTTEVVFEIATKNNQTTIDFTHIGLVPTVECYAACEKGWDDYFGNSLLQFINEGKGNPQ